jgi:uncharacterized damage-inducible protein DinB
MSALEMISSLVEYHCEFTRRVWESIGLITEEQFTQQDAYSHGSIRNLMVHLSSTDRRWLAGLKNLPDVGHVNFDHYPDRKSARAFFEQVAAELMAYVKTLDESGLNNQPTGLPATRWQVLVHQVNHGTDHRATVLQKLHALSVPTYGQDFIMWLWKK